MYKILYQIQVVQSTSLLACCEQIAQLPADDLVFRFGLVPVHPLRVVLLADSVERLMGTKAEARFAFISDKAEFASDDLLDI